MVGTSLKAFSKLFIYHYIIILDLIAKQPTHTQMHHGEAVCCDRPSYSYKVKTYVADTKLNVCNVHMTIKIKKLFTETFE